MWACRLNNAFIILFLIFILLYSLIFSSRIPFVPFMSSIPGSVFGRLIRIGSLPSDVRSACGFFFLVNYGSCNKTSQQATARHKQSALQTLSVRSITRGLCTDKCSEMKSLLERKLVGNADVSLCHGNSSVAVR